MSGANISIAADANILESAGGNFEMSGVGTTILGGPMVDIHGGIIKLNC